jgi:hypothetical protein
MASELDRYCSDNRSFGIGTSVLVVEGGCWYVPRNTTPATSRTKMATMIPRMLRFMAQSLENVRFFGLRIGRATGG